MEAPARSPSVRSILSTAFLVVVTTAGALVGLGIRRADDMSTVFQIIGRNILNSIGRAEVATAWQAALVGSLHHLVVATFWGVLLAPLVLRLRGEVRVLICLLFAPLYTIVAVFLLTPVLRIGHVVTSSVADVFPIAAALAVALLGGAWVSGVPLAPDRGADSQRPR